jgi:hypothetical protein
VFGRDARSEQPLDRGSDDRRTGAAIGSGRGKDFNGDKVLRGNETPPGLRHGGSPREVRKSAGHHLANVIRPGTESVCGLRVFNDDYARGRFAEAER